MKKYILLLCYLTLSVAHAQQIRFNKLIKILPYVTEGGYCVDQRSDGSYIVAGSLVDFSASDSTKYYRLFIAIVDSLGNLKHDTILGENKNDFGAGFYTNSIVKVKMNDFMLVGYKTDSSKKNGKSLVIRIDSTGNIKWLKEYQGVWEKSVGIDMIQVKENHFLLVSYLQRSSDLLIETLIQKLDQDGNIIWTKQYGSLLPYRGFVPLKICKGNENEFYISGYTAKGSINKVQIIKIDSIGSIYWTKQYGGIGDNYGYVNFYNNDTLLVHGKTNTWDNYLGYINSVSGDSLVFFKIQSSIEDAGRQVLYSKSNLSLFGYKSEKSPDSNGNHIVGWIIRFNPNFSIKWQRTFYKHKNWDNYFNSSNYTSDQGYIITGFAHDSTATKGSADIWLVKTDSFGCDVPGCQLIDGIAPLLPGQGASMQLYPNPAAAQGPVHVQYLLRKPGQLTVTLTDINGKQVAEIPFYSHATEGSLSMDMSWLKPGIYTLTLQTETGLTHQKLLLQ